MATSTIIRSITESLLQILTKDLTGIVVAAKIKAAPPETVAGITGPALLLYLYQVLENPHLKNVGPHAVLQPRPASNTVVQRDPLALDLHYLLIPFSTEHNFLDTYNILGAAMKSFHDHGIFSPGALGLPGLPADEAKLEFRLTLNPLTTADLIRLWEAVHHPYRLSVAYVVRTVQIDSGLQTDTRLVTERRFVVDEKK